MKFQNHMHYLEIHMQEVRQYLSYLDDCLKPVCGLLKIPSQSIIGRAQWPRNNGLPKKEELKSHNKDLYWQRVSVHVLYLPIGNCRTTM